MSKIMHKLFELHGGKPYFSLRFIQSYNQNWDTYKIEFNKSHIENARKQKSMDEINKLDHIIANKNDMLLEFTKNHVNL